MSLTQDTPQEQASGDKPELDVSYNYFASFDPHGGPSLAATEPQASANLPRQTEERYGQEIAQGRCETPPPTVPFSEDILYDQLTVEKDELPPATINVSEMNTHDQDAGPDPITASEDKALESKKNQRPKNQSPAVMAGDQTDRDSSPDELAMDEIVKHQTEVVRGQKDPLKPDKPVKKKVRRSKTISDSANSEMVDRDIPWIDDTPVFELEKDINAKTTKHSISVVVPPSEEITREPHNDGPSTNVNKPEPKKRGRRKKSTTRERPATCAEPSALLQDIPPTHKLPDNDQETSPGRIENARLNTANETEPPQEDLETATLLTETSANQKYTTPSKTNEESPATTTKEMPARHSPIPSTSKVPFRVGLSRRARIAPLLKVVRK